VAKPLNLHGYRAIELYGIKSLYYYYAIVYPNPICMRRLRRRLTSQHFVAAATNSAVCLPSVHLVAARLGHVFGSGSILWQPLVASCWLLVASCQCCRLQVVLVARCRLVVGCRLLADGCWLSCTKIVARIAAGNSSNISILFLFMLINR